MAIRQKKHARFNIIVGYFRTIGRKFFFCCRISVNDERRLVCWETFIFINLNAIAKFEQTSVAQENMHCERLMNL